MKIALAGKDPGEFQAPPVLTPSSTAQKIDTPDTAPGADETH
jgi:hypothetical protein